MSAAKMPMVKVPRTVGNHLSFPVSPISRFNPKPHLPVLPRCFALLLNEFNLTYPPLPSPKAAAHSGGRAKGKFSVDQ